MFQDFNLLPGLTAAENVALPVELDGTPAREARRVAMTALDDLGTAGALALLGAVLSLRPLVAAYHAGLGRLAAPRVVHLLLLGFGLPTVATAAGSLLAGREPRTFARQVLD